MSRYCTGEIHLFFCLLGLNWTYCKTDMDYFPNRVSESTVCKMPVSNLAKVFGPTLVGYSVPDPDPSILVMETHQQQNVRACVVFTSSDLFSVVV